MRTILQGFILFLMWASIGRWYYVCKVKSHCTPTTEEARLLQTPKTLCVYHPDTLMHRGYEQFVFASNSPVTSFTSNNISFLNRLVAQLQQQQELELNITGFYLNTEESIPSTSYKNLGEARAAQLQDWIVQRGIDPERIQIQAKMTEGKRLIEPLKFRLLTHAHATAGK